MQRPRTKSGYKDTTTTTTTDDNDDDVWPKIAFAYVNHAECLRILYVLHVLHPLICFCFYCCWCLFVLAFIVVDLRATIVVVS